MSKKAYSFNNLSEIIDEEFQWRRKELFILKNKIPLDKSSLQKAFLRAGTTMLYAHIEGFIKNTSTYYLQFISFKNLKHSELKPEFIAICLKNKFINTHLLDKQKILINFFLNEIESKANLPYKSIVNTHSNLNYSVFEEILMQIGFDVNKFEKRKALLDDLVSLRNTIAHGEFKEIDLNTYIGFNSEIESLMTEFKTEIENSAIQETFKQTLPIANSLHNS